jgi:hypothetical protein
MGLVGVELDVPKRSPAKKSKAARKRALRKQQEDQRDRVTYVSRPAVRVPKTFVSVGGVLAPINRSRLLRAGDLLVSSQMKTPALRLRNPVMFGAGAAMNLRPTKNPLIDPQAARAFSNERAMIDAINRNWTHVFSGLRRAVRSATQDGDAPAVG